MKKLSGLLLVAMLVLAGCGSSSSMDEELTIFNLKVEMDPALQTLATEYTAETGVPVTVKSVGGGADYGAALKAEFESGNEPDLFVVSGAGDVDIWSDVLYDMNDAEWAQNTELEYVDSELGTVGFPIGIESYGLICDNTVLEEAKVDYTTVKSLSDLETAFAAIKETGVDPVSYTTKETWVTGNHSINMLFAGSGQEAFDAYLAGDGEALSYDGYADMISLLMTNSYGDLSTIDYDTQVANFTTGKTACLHQGNWALGNIEAAGMTTENLVMLPLPYNEATTGKIPVGVPSYFAVNKNADSQKAVEFLDYMATSEAGHKFMVEDAKMIPAFTNVELQPSDPISQQIMQYNKDSNTVQWMFTQLPDGFGMNTYGPIFDQFYKTGDKDAFIQNLKDAAASIK